MATPDLRERGLDPAHILSVASQAIGSGHGHASRATATPGGLRVYLSSRLAADGAAPALTRVGYQVARINGTGHRDLLVTGWSSDGLESRLTAMRAVLHRLDGNPGSTADAVIERVRRLPAHPETRVLADARTQLQAWVSACSGIHAPRNPAIMPADTGNALRLGLAHTLENAIDDLVERHLRVAGHALPLFLSLRQHTTEAQAKEAAIRRAGIIFHLNATPPGAAAPVQHPAQPPGPGAPSPGHQTGTPRPPGGPARQASSGFPSPLPGAVPGTGAVPAGRPAGGRFPASRPGYRR